MDSPISYVGPSELHDGHVLLAKRAGDRALVRVRGHGGREVALEFLGVAEFAAVHPEGMLLHGLAEIRTDDPARHFIFANEEEWDDSSLEITARDFRVVLPGTELPDA